MAEIVTLKHQETGVVVTCDSTVAAAMPAEWNKVGSETVQEPQSATAEPVAAPVEPPVGEPIADPLGEQPVE